MFHSKKTATIAFIITVLLFGTIACIRVNMETSSALVAFVRGLLGAFVLLIFSLFKKHSLDIEGIKNNLWLLILSGVSIGINWYLLFESFSYTTTATASLCNYMAPIFVLLFAPFVLKEKFTIKNGICTLLSFLGIVFVSGVLQNGFSGTKGILMSLLSALFYSAVILINKKMKPIHPEEKSMIQLLFASLVLVPYLFVRNEMKSLFSISAKDILLLLLLGIVYTGIAYTFYFAALEVMDASSAAILSYLDPVVTVLLSILVLRESFTIFTILGAILIIGSAVLSECKFKVTYIQHR